MIEPAQVQDLVARWWWNYDEGNFDVLTGLLTEDVHFSCRTDTGATDYEEFVRADHTGRDAVMAWQTDHRLQQPVPAAAQRHERAHRRAARRRSELRVVHLRLADRRWCVAVVDRDRQRPRAPRQGDALLLAELEVVLDTMDSKAFTER